MGKITKIVIAVVLILAICACVYFGFVKKAKAPEVVIQPAATEEIVVEPVVDETAVPPTEAEMTDEVVDTEAVG